MGLGAKSNVAGVRLRIYTHVRNLMERRNQKLKMLDKDLALCERQFLNLDQPPGGEKGTSLAEATPTWWERALKQETELNWLPLRSRWGHFGEGS